MPDPTITPTRFLSSLPCASGLASFSIPAARSACAAQRTAPGAEAEG